MLRGSSVLLHTLGISLQGAPLAAAGTALGLAAARRAAADMVPHPTAAKEEEEEEQRRGEKQQAHQQGQTEDSEWMEVVDQRTGAVARH